MSDFLFVAGQIRALEGKMLTNQQLERMVGAPTATDSFRVLVELAYAKYINNSTTADDFQDILDQGLLETKALITQSSENFPELDLIWLKYDLGNIKSAYRMKLAGAEGISAFARKEGFSALGAISQNSLEALVWHHEADASISPAFAEAVGELADENQFEVISSRLDTAWVDAMRASVKKHKTAFSTGYFQRLIDTANLSAWTRARYSFEVPYTPELHLDGGIIDYSDLAHAKTPSELVDPLSGTPYESLVRSMPKAADADEMIEQMEGKCETFLMRYVVESESGAISTVEIPLAYFERRAHNARLIKLVLFSKLAGIAPEEIQKRVDYYSL